MPQMCHTSDHIESMEQGTSEAGLRTGTAAPSGRSYTRASSSGGASTSTSANGSGSSTGHNAGHSLHQEGRPAGDGTGGRAGFGARVQALTGAVQNVLEAARPAEEPYDTAAASAERHRRVCQTYLVPVNSYDLTWQKAGGAPPLLTVSGGLPVQVSKLSRLGSSSLCAVGGEEFTVLRAPTHALCC